VKVDGCCKNSFFLVVENYFETAMNLEVLLDQRQTISIRCNVIGLGEELLPIVFHE
jgi:hypothetical protein